MKIVYSDKKTGRAAQAEISAENASAIFGKKIGDTIEGDMINLGGYKLKITGGSDSSGFPMHKYVQGYVKTGVLRDSTKKGSRSVRRKTVVGGMIGTTTAQINAVVVEYGSRPVEEVFPKKEKEAKAQEKS